MLDISEKRFLAILPQINFLLSLLIVFHHGFISIVRYNGSFFPFSYERYLYSINMLNIFKYCQSKKFSLLNAFIFIRSYAKQKHDNMYCKKI